MNDQPNITYLFIGKDLAPKTTGTVESYADMTDGQLAVLNEANAAQDGVDDVTRFRIALRSGTSLLFSPFIEKATITNANCVNYVAPVQQISYIGYDGVSGSFAAINSNVYKVRVELDGSPLAQFGNKRMLKFGVYKSDSAATQQEVAHGILDNLIMNFKEETLAHLHFELINSCPLANDSPLASSDDATIVQGLNTFTVANHFQYDTNTAAVVGDYVRIADSATNAVALTSAVYKVTGISGTTITVDRPILSASGVYDAAHGDLTVIPVASIGSLFGIKVTGIANPFQVGKWKYFVTTFTIDLQDFGATTVTYSTAAVQGVGYGAQIQEDEYLLQGNWGNKYRGDIWAPEFFKNAVATSQYNQLSFNFRLDGGEQLGYRVSQVGTIRLALINDISEDNLILAVFQADTAYFPAATCPDFS
jgi:hypothetical protein